ncbi:MAG: EutN/CcmL family microcompartment protein [Cyanobacteria bacterium J06641_5]
MQLACVRGTVVSTHKLAGLSGVKLLMVQYIDDRGQLLPGYEVAADPVGAGSGEWVLVNRGSAARQESGNESRPLDAMVIALVIQRTVIHRYRIDKRNEY